MSLRSVCCSARESSLAMREILPRSAWGARMPSRATALDLSRVDRVFVHHTTGAQRPDVESWIRSIQRFHTETRGWSDIGYSFLVSADGRIWEGRGARTTGAHTKGYNSRSWAIAYLGDGSSLPPDAALDGIAYCWGWLENLLGRRLPLYGHRDVGRTACPGDALYAWSRTANAVMPSAPQPAPRRSPVPDLREGYLRMLDRMRSRRL